MSDSFFKRFGKLAKPRRQDSATGQEAPAQDTSRMTNLGAGPQPPEAKAMVDLLDVLVQDVAEEQQYARYGLTGSEQLPRGMVSDIIAACEADHASADQIAQQVAQKEAEYKELRDHIAMLTQADASLSPELSQALGLIDAQDWNGADRLLAQAEEQQTRTRPPHEWNIALEIATLRAAALTLQGHALQAVEHIIRGMGYLAPYDRDAAAGKTRALADELHSKGVICGVEPLAAAIQLYRHIATLWTREQSPDNWAMLKNDMAVSCRHLGLRLAQDGGEAWLARAVTACEAALEIYTRARAPEDWAMTQNSLGNALQNQAQLSTSGAEPLLARAVTAFEGALEVFTKQAAPQHWGSIQNNLGDTLRNQAQYAQGADAAQLLARAVGAFEATLEICTRNAAPLQWAQTQENLAILFTVHAGRVQAAHSDLARAETHILAALEVFDPVQMPAQFAKANGVLDNIRTSMAALP